MLLVHVCGQRSSPQRAVYNLGSAAPTPLTAIGVLFTGGPQIVPEKETKLMLKVETMHVG